MLAVSTVLRAAVSSLDDVEERTLVSVTDTVPVSAPPGPELTSEISPPPEPYWPSPYPP